MRPARLVAAVLGAALLLSGCGSTGADDGPAATIVAGDDHGFHGTWLDQPYQPAATALTDTAGDPVELDSADAPLRLVFFGYTNCPDVCQVVMSTMASALTRLDPDQRDQVQGVFVTTDPARDTRQVLRSYLDRFDPSFLGLTGSLADIVAAGKPLGIYVEKGQKLASGGYEVTHTAAVIGVAHGKGRVVWTQGTSPADMAADVEKLLKEKA